jgi:hypothetical protein
MPRSIELLTRQQVEAARRMKPPYGGLYINVCIGVGGIYTPKTLIVLYMVPIHPSCSFLSVTGNDLDASTDPSSSFVSSFVDFPAGKGYIGGWLENRASYP